MSSSLITAELGRAWQAYFRERGGELPSIPSEIVPVLILDDNSKGPYPPCRHWHATIQTAQSAGNFTFAGILNNDDSKSTFSCCVVDRLFVKANLGIASDYVLGVSGAAVPNLATGGVRECILEKEQKNVAGNITDPLFNNVQAGSGANASSLVTSSFPGGAFGIVSEIPGPFVIGPQQQFVIASGIVNNGIFVYFRGRYYPSI